MRNRLVQHAACPGFLIRTRVVAIRFACKIDNPFGSLIAPFGEVRQVLGHVLVWGVGRANRVARLAVLAEKSGVGVGLEASVLLSSTGSAAVGDFAATVGPGLVFGAAGWAEGEGCDDCEMVSNQVIGMLKRTYS